MNVIKLLEKWFPFIKFRGIKYTSTGDDIYIIVNNISINDDWFLLYNPKNAEWWIRFYKNHSMIFSDLLKEFINGLINRDYY